MERLFSPCTRLHDLLESHGDIDEFRGLPEPFLELNLDVSTSEFLSPERAFTYADLYTMLGNQNTLLWLTPHVAVARERKRVLGFWAQLDESRRCCFSGDNKHIVALARSPEHLLEIGNVVLRLVAACADSVVLEKASSINPVDAAVIVNASSLVFMMEQRQSLTFLALKDVKMDEHHCRVLGDFSRPGLKIVLISCKLTNSGASALAEVLGRNQGPTSLLFCEMDNFVLADGLRGNISLKRLSPLLSGNNEVSNREVLAIAGALKENKGLVESIFFLSASG